MERTLADCLLWRYDAEEDYELLVRIEMPRILLMEDKSEQRIKTFESIVY